jgi:hypothetical protein
MATAAIEPRVSPGWVDWEGGDCPVSPDTNIQVQFRLDICREYAEKVSGPRGNFAGVYGWANTGSGGDIIAYRVIS